MTRHANVALWRMIDRASQLAFLAGCIALIVVAVGRYGGARSDESRADGSILRGETVPQIPTVDFGSADRTVLVAIDPSCIHCTNSMPFYSKLVAQTARAKRNVRVVFAARHAADATRTYLERHGVRPDSVVPTPLTLSIRGTPTLLVIDASGKVLGGWFGRLNPEQEEMVLTMVG